MRRVLVALLLLLAVGYVGINFVGLPPLLVAENLALAATYAALGAALLRGGGRKILGVVLLVASFNAGRVSRSIWSPVTGFGGLLAVEHIPLLLYLVAVSILALIPLVRGG
ncbi:hypothetical protein [Pyrobaculum ferrireducens]|uniref:Uncharacterized protein n=1 Tax=Pyrobaculum ferrireducens TaxID=1104324 RepID=G7VEX2_9CREN|nr:hypothetical protein [Pyrobaculum ferrireducens]AET34137.1 hypothetical protein P186_2760 [Pyrobaculum ferrireducens]